MTSLDNLIRKAREEYEADQAEQRRLQAEQEAWLAEEQAKVLPAIRDWLAIEGVDIPLTCFFAPRGIKNNVDRCAWFADVEIAVSELVVIRCAFWLKSDLSVARHNSWNVLFLNGSSGFYHYNYAGGTLFLDAINLIPGAEAASRAALEEERERFAALTEEEPEEPKVAPAPLLPLDKARSFARQAECLPSEEAFESLAHGTALLAIAHALIAIAEQA